MKLIVTRHISHLRSSPFMHSYHDSEVKQPDTQINNTHNDTEVKQPYTPANAKCTRQVTCSAAKSCSKIVLCKVYHKDNPEISINSYVVLDDQSNVSLGSPDLFDSLSLNGPSYPYELSTCAGDPMEIEGRCATDLVVESINGNKENLPTIIENEHIPGDHAEIPTPDLCMKFPHLNRIAAELPCLNHIIKVHLLLGRAAQNL